MMMGTRGLFEMWTWMASLGFLAMLRQFIPREYTDSLRRNCKLWFQRLTPYIFCDIPEFENSISNSLYQDVEVYISSLRVDGAQRMSLCKTRNSKALTFALANDQRTIDTFDKAKVEWVHKVLERNRPMYANYFESQSDERRAYTLQIGKKDKERVLDKYIAHIENKALELKLAARELLLFTNTKGREYFTRRSQGPWQSVPFKHPASFDTLALDGDLKSRVIADLENFSANENYYKRIGKAWKRGYLLYGPPGTGKSSMIAAIANKMRYDVYDLELTEVSSNTELRKLLLNTSNKAVVVIEDIDCSLDLSGQRKKKRKEEAKAATTTSTTSGAPGGPRDKEDKENEQSKVTLSGLLNFVDGLWSCCGAERIFIFTTNYMEKLDPALLRAGRMDMHIHLSYCTFSAFKQLAVNYLEITEHELFPKLEAAFEGSFITPAQVSEHLIINQAEDVDVVLERLIVALDGHRVDPLILKKKKEEEEEEEAAKAEASLKSEDENKTKDSPPTPDVPEDKQSVAETTSPTPADSAKVELKETQIGSESTDLLKEDQLRAKGGAAENLADKDVGEVEEISDATTKSVYSTRKETTEETTAETKTGSDESSAQLQAV